MHRYTSTPFPPYKFIPGHGKHPEKEGGYLHGNKTKAEKLTIENYQSNFTYLYAIDLFNKGHYWDAHVYWEILWNLAGRKGETADFLKSLIKIAAAGVKYQLNQAGPAQDHLARAEELTLPLPITQFGLSIFDYVKKVQRTLSKFGLEFEFSEKLELKN